MNVYFDYFLKLSVWLKVGVSKILNLFCFLFFFWFVYSEIIFVYRFDFGCNLVIVNWLLIEFNNLRGYLLGFFLGIWMIFNMIVFEVINWG